MTFRAKTDTKQERTKQFYKFWTELKRDGGRRLGGGVLSASEDYKIA